MSDDFDLLESIRCEDREFLWLDRHLDRMAASASLFGFRFHPDAINEALDAVRDTGPIKVRLTLSQAGKVVASSTPLGSLESVRLAVARTRVNSNDVSLFHKTTDRRIYQEALSSRPEADDVVLINERGEITEATSANILLRKGSSWLTPRMSCGLLPGIQRAVLLESGEVAEELLMVEDLRLADEVALVNSVRLRRPAALGP
jgi:para-aminobenzoate synthetase/4-amino-4-deoxychorismate lyase